MDYPDYRLIDNGVCIVELVKIPDQGQIPNPVHPIIGDLTFNWFQNLGNGYVLWHATLKPRLDGAAKWFTDSGKVGDVVVGGPNDVDFNGFVTGDDYDIFAQQFFDGNLAADWDDDGFVTGADFDIFLKTW